MSAQCAPRVVLHIDLDAFYAQCESKRDPSLKGLPLGVVQYNPVRACYERPVAPLSHARRTRSLSQAACATWR
jgi:nucleotidyltransferase/DNA polymerase involved in DNA repair